MKPSSEKNYIMLCHDHEIEPKFVRMAGGDVLARWKCPTCKDQRSYKIAKIDNTKVKNE